MATKKRAATKSKRVVKILGRSQRSKNEYIFREGEKLIAKKLKIPLSKLPEVDPDTRMEAARQVLIDDEENEIFSLPIQLKPDEYKGLVGFYFSLMLTFTADKPLNVRAEMKRYIKALQAIQKTLPKGKRAPSDEVQAAIELRNKGYEWPAIYPLVLKRLGSMDDRARRKMKKDFRRNVTSLLKVRKRRAQKNGGNTSQK